MVARVRRDDVVQVSRRGRRIIMKTIRDGRRDNDDHDDSANRTKKTCCSGADDDDDDVIARAYENTRDSCINNIYTRTGDGTQRAATGGHGLRRSARARAREHRRRTGGRTAGRILRLSRTGGGANYTRTRTRRAVSIPSRRRRRVYCYSAAAAGVNRNQGHSFPTFSCRRRYTFFVSPFPETINKTFHRAAFIAVRTRDGDFSCFSGEKFFGSQLVRTSSFDSFSSNFQYIFHSCLFLLELRTS